MKKFFVGSLLLFSCVILLSGWKTVSIPNAKHEITIIQLQQDGEQTGPDKAYTELKKQGEKQGIQFYWHQWQSIADLNNFFATNKLSINAAYDKKFSLTAKDGGVRFVTPKKQVTIIIKDKQVYYFLDDPLESQTKKIKEIVGLRASI